ncbi:MAG: DUF2334 domain-containing protein [Acidobacteriota bacterium]
MHDVAPPTREQVRRLLDMLTEAGVNHRSLLVIPNLRGRHPIDADSDFCAWLKSLNDRGDEVVLHGYEHIEVVAPTRPTERFRNRWFTQGEGEFLSLDRRHAGERIAMGRTLLARAGFDPQGFVAPAWLINDAGLNAARDQGLQYTNSYLHFTDLARGRSCLAPSLVFGPGHLDEDIGIALQRVLSKILSRYSLVRVALHPPCVEYLGRMKRVLSMLVEQLRAHTPITYLQLLGEMRAASPEAGPGLRVP